MRKKQSSNKAPSKVGDTGEPLNYEMQDDTARMIAEAAIDEALTHPRRHRFIFLGESVDDDFVPIG